MAATCYYDDALPRFAALVVGNLGEAALHEHLFLRDNVGRLTLILRGETKLERHSDAFERLTRAVRAELVPYVDAVVVATPEEIFDATLAQRDAGYWERLPNGSVVRVVERWLVGQDWQAPPRAAIEGAPPIVVFASHKGGVGRSTALAVAAADFASHGHNVLTIDLDLEAPGLGSMLLPEDRLPGQGAVDFFVENGLCALDDDFFNDLYGISPLTGGGLVHVIPAVGRRSMTHPQNLIGKLARAYLEDPSPEGPRSFLSQARDLIAGMTRRHSYDVVLVDSRAGLHETTAAAILGLGADVLLFGIDTPQTFQGYQFLLAHLTRFLPPEADDWRWRLRLVHAKAVADARRQRSFNDRAFDLFQEHLYDKDTGESDKDPFTFGLDDTEAPHYPWRILSDSTFAEFDPLAHPEQLEDAVYARTFGPFVDALRERVMADHAAT